MTGMTPQLKVGPPMVEPRLMDVVRQMGSAFRGAGAFVDTISLRVRDASSSDALVDESLHMISEGSGGRFIHNENNFAAALGEIDASTATGYRIGFNMPHDAKKGDNSIDVKVRNVPFETRLSFR